MSPGPASRTGSCQTSAPSEREPDTTDKVGTLKRAYGALKAPDPRFTRVRVCIQVKEEVQCQHNSQPSRRGGGLAEQRQHPPG